MSDHPEIPNEFDSKEEVKAYVAQLHTQIDLLAKRIEGPQKEELRQELNEIEPKATHGSGGPESFAAIRESLESVQEQIEEFEERYLAEDSEYGLPDRSPLNDALDYDVTQDVDGVGEELGNE
ncbi:hypothetical protein [Halostella salina]|uniref:hypothetical protein n=1 Tax=Halostella salina TaxID=1547897 RepID=UPI000EF7671D|nr:hypothetical protein [Halostella salina]